jgi:RNA polymerase sigma-70 factor, ECF subfamily
MEKIGGTVFGPPGETAPEPGGNRSAIPDWSALVERIRTGDPRGMEELYALFSRGIRFYLCRQLGAQELDDKVHDTFLIVVQAIRRNELREPERLMGFVRTVVRRQVAAFIDKAVHARREQADIDSGLVVTDNRRTPEEDVIARQKTEIMVKVLRSVSKQDREILTRFYLLGQTQERICMEMKLTHTQFRLLKSRAKARFGELGKRRLNLTMVKIF